MSYIANDFDGAMDISAKRLVASVRSKVSKVSATVAKVRHSKPAPVAQSLHKASLVSEESLLVHTGLRTPPSTPSTPRSLQLLDRPTPSPILTDTQTDRSCSFTSEASATSSPSVSPKNRLGRNQGRLQVCWAYAIGNAVAHGAHATSGVLLNPETIAHALMADFRRFDTHSVRRVMHYLQDKWSDPERPFIISTLKESGDDVDLDRPVCVYISDVQCFGAEMPEPFPEQPGWYQHDARDFEAFRTHCASGDVSAVVSVWTRTEGSARTEGHAVALEKVAGSAIECKNSHPSEPVLYACFNNFKAATTFRVHVCAVEDADLLTSRYGCHFVTRRGAPITATPKAA
eukprot:TRINITY_DN6745_c0_g1_i1.p1 TRINITY_DN6745_c0_g1~~TRINITY_DN6745_c0_g1_i1.p1  ORF type:complete len:352 (-),score=30.89 TRINITY_DN6745_c0_g1_i1:1122-2156(-)